MRGKERRAKESKERAARVAEFQLRMAERQMAIELQHAQARPGNKARKAKRQAECAPGPHHANAREKTRNLKRLKVNA